MTEEVIERLARIETKLDDALPRLGDHETRIRANEKWASGLAGWQGVLTLVLGAVFYKLR